MVVTRQIVKAGLDDALGLFEAIAEAGDEAQLVVDIRGERVLDLAANTSPDALTTVFSVSKGLSAIALATLVDDGRLDIDELVTSYWPEFGAAGKESVTVRQLLSHQAGLPSVDGGIPPEAFLDHHQAAALLAAQRPFWRPGSAFGYHAVSIGSLMSELCFRITGQTMQAFYDTRVRVPAGADAFLGLPEEYESRVSELLPMSDPTPAELAEFGEEIAAPRGPYGPVVFGPMDVLTSKAGRAFGHPAGGGVASARGLADVYSWATGYGSPTSGAISAQTLSIFGQAQVVGYDLVLDQKMRSHGIVFQKATPAMRIGSHRAFGHDGAGGALAMADPESELVLGYTIRRVPFPGGVDRRVFGIIDAVRTALG